MNAKRTVALSLSLFLAATSALHGAAAGHSRQSSYATAPLTDAAALAILSPLPAADPYQPSPYQERLEAWALRRFQQAHLQLPTLEIRYRPHRRDCDGRPGYFGGKADNWTVAVCTSAPFVLLHELGHAWVAHNLTDSERETFREARGLSTWNNPTVPHDRRATEHAADLIAWGLSGQQTHLRTYPNAGYAELSEAFEMLTGSPPLVERSERATPAR